MIRRGGTSLLLCFMRDGAKNIAKRGTWFDKKSIIAQNYQDELDRLRQPIVEEDVEDDDEYYYSELLGRYVKFLFTPEMVEDLEEKGLNIDEFIMTQPATEWTSKYGKELQLELREKWETLHGMEFSEAAVHKIERIKETPPQPPDLDQHWREFTYKPRVRHNHDQLDKKFR